MPESPPLTVPPDPNAFGVPTNDRPTPPAADATPRDVEREQVVSPGATHVVIADSLGGRWERGDKIKAEDLPRGADIDRLVNLKPFPALRPLTDEEKRGVPLTKEQADAKAKADADAKAKAKADADAKAKADAEAAKKDAK
jgi:colicin import membrane protein